MRGAGHYQPRESLGVVGDRGERAGLAGLLAISLAACSNYC
jgi:hypothetical protein